MIRASGNLRGRMPEAMVTLRDFINRALDATMSAENAIHCGNENLVLDTDVRCSICALQVVDGCLARTCPCCQTHYHRACMEKLVSGIEDDTHFQDSEGAHPSIMQGRWKGMEWVNCSLLFALCSFNFPLCSLLLALGSWLFALCTLLFAL